MGRTEFRPKDYMRTFVIDDEFVNQSAIEATPRSEGRLTFKNALTQPRLLEMDVKPAIRKGETELPAKSRFGKFSEVSDK